MFQTNTQEPDTTTILKLKMKQIGLNSFELLVKLGWLCNGCATLYLIKWNGCYSLAYISQQNLRISYCLEFSIPGYPNYGLMTSKKADDRSTFLVKDHCIPRRRLNAHFLFHPLPWLPYLKHTCGHGQFCQLTQAKLMVSEEEWQQTWKNCSLQRTVNDTILL